MLLSALDNVGYSSHCVSDGRTFATMSSDAGLDATTSGGSETPAPPLTDRDLLRGSVHVHDFTKFTPIAVPVTPFVHDSLSAGVVVSLDVAQFTHCPPVTRRRRRRSSLSSAAGGSAAVAGCTVDNGSASWPLRQFVNKLVAGRPRLVVFSAATPGILSTFSNGI